jgi:hypothetical protein
VAAVGEVAALGQLLQVLEGGGHGVGVGPQAEGPDARRVDQHPARRQQVDLAGGRGVAALGVGGPDGADHGHVGAHQGVGEARLPGARLAEQHDRAARGPLPQVVDALAGHGGRDDDVDPGAGPGRVLGGGHHLVVGEAVGLGEDDHGLGGGVPGRGDGAAEAAGAHRSVEAADDQDHVDVGDQRLLDGAAGVAAAQQRAAVEGGDDGFVAADDPVAHDGLGLDGGEHRQLPGAVGPGDHHRHAVVADDPAGDQAVPALGRGGEQRQPAVVPAVGVKGDEWLGHTEGSSRRATGPRELTGRRPHDEPAPERG